MIKWSQKGLTTPKNLNHYEPETAVNQLRSYETIVTKDLIPYNNRSRNLIITKLEMEKKSFHLLNKHCSKQKMQLTINNEGEVSYGNRAAAIYML